MTLHLCMYCVTLKFWNKECFSKSVFYIAEYVICGLVTLITYSDMECNSVPYRLWVFSYSSVCQRVLWLGWAWNILVLRVAVSSLTNWNIAVLVASWCHCCYRIHLIYAYSHCHFLVMVEMVNLKCCFSDPNKEMNGTDMQCVRLQYHVEGSLL